MSGRKVLLTIPDPPGSSYKGSHDTIVRSLRGVSPVFSTGVFYRGTEDNGGNSLGALFPVVHVSTDAREIRAREDKSSALDRTLVLPGHMKVGLNQGVYIEQDQDDLGDGKHRRHTTNAIILVGCKVLEAGSRTAKGMEASWRTWTNIGLLCSKLESEHIELQTAAFLRQIVPRDPHIFMYCILLSLRLNDLEDETTVLALLQQMRGSVITGYAALYISDGGLSKSRSEESMERLIEGASGGKEGRREQNRRSHNEDEVEEEEEHHRRGHRGSRSRRRDEDERRRKRHHDLRSVNTI